jgi:Ca2+-binding EF-hand superfamily protein
LCDYNYQKEVSTGDFKNKLKEFELGLSEKTMARLIGVLDENYNGSISLEEYYFALETFNCRCEPYGPFDNQTGADSFQWKAVYKLLEAMKDRNISEDELFRTIDTDGDGKISLKEMEDAINIFSQFGVKEKHTIHNFFDIDNNGSVEEYEYKKRMRYAN